MTGTGPLVSVVIPTYNRKEMLTRAVESVLGQTYGNLEVIVVDDGSTDGTAEHLTGFLSDERFRYFYQENRGQSAARNHGISQATGKIIAFLDSDNFWHKEKLKLQLAYWDKHKDFNILYSEGITVDIAGKVISKNVPISNRPSGNILKTLMTWNCVTNNTVLVPKQCFQEMGGFNESLRIAEDFDLWLRFATRYTFVFHPEKVTYYCIEGERLSAQEEQNIEVNFQILEIFRQKFPGAVSVWTFRKALGNLRRWKIESYWNRGIRPALLDIIYSLFYNPLDHRTWRHLVKYLLLPVFSATVQQNSGGISDDKINLKTGNE